MLSPWALQLSDTDWPLSYQADFRPLRPGLADAREFPHEIWARCLRRSALRRRFNDQTVINRPSLREALRDYLEVSRGVRAEADQVLILPTAQAALTLIAATTIVAGDAVWTEDPGYPGAAAAFRAALMAVASGDVDSAIALGVEKMTDKAGHDVTAALATAADADYEVEQGVSFVGLNALIIQRYMYEYDVPLDAFASSPA